MQQFAREEIGQRIAQARREAGGMTQKELGEALNVSERSVQDFESGKTIPWKYFERMEQVFRGKTLSWFLHGEEPASLEIAEELAERLEGVAERFEALAARLEALLAGQGPGQSVAEQ